MGGFAETRSTRLPLLEGRAIGRRIAKGWTWRNLTFSLPRGGVLGLSGPSGTGKTLLLRALVGLDPLDEGEIRAEGRALDSRHLPHHRARVSYVAQRPALFPGNVEDNLRLPFALRMHRSTSFDRSQALTRLAALGRGEDFLARPTGHLSGGEAQIMALIRVLAISPQVLLLDEPTAALDEGASRGVERLVRAFLDQAPDRACLWVSHDAGQLDRVADQRLRLEVPR